MINDIIKQEIEKGEPVSVYAVRWKLEHEGIKVSNDLIIERLKRMKVQYY